MWNRNHRRWILCRYSPQRNFNQNIRQEDDPFAAAMNMQGDEAAPPTQQYMQQPQQLQQPQQRYSQPSSPTRMNNTRWTVFFRDRSK